MHSKIAKLAAAGLLAAAAGLPPLGQQTQLNTRPGSGVVRERDKPHGLWGNKRKHKPRTLTPEARAKHEAKMQRRYERWVAGIAENPCISAERKAMLLGASVHLA